MYLIRVSSSIHLGKGHISRCKRIRNKIKSKVIWFIDKGTKEIYFKLSKDEVIEEYDSSSTSELEKYLILKDTTAILIDMPLLQKKNLEKISSIKPTILLVDKYFNHHKTLRICFHPIVSKESNFISGFKYLPFLKKKRKFQKNSSKINILISFGGIDSNRLTEKVIKTFKEIFFSKLLLSDDYRINIAVGEFNRNINSIKKMIFSLKQFKIYSNLSNLDKLYKMSHFAIGAPGFSQLERIEYAIPTILVSQNKTHIKLLQYWRLSGCAVVAENLGNDLKSKIVSLLKSETLKQKINNNIKKKFDDKGLVRIIKKMESFCKEFNLRKD